MEDVAPCSVKVNSQTAEVQAYCASCARNKVASPANEKPLSAAATERHLSSNKVANAPEDIENNKVMMPDRSISFYW